MSQVTYRNETTTDQSKIIELLKSQGVPFEHWGVRASQGATQDEILEQYKNEVDRLKTSQGYITADVVALNRETPNLETICQKFDKEHHHVEDEVRFTVAGEGVFEILDQEKKEMIKVTTGPGDLIVIPANRRHLFYLTDQKNIQCIRLFKTKEGWEAIY